MSSRQARRVSRHQSSGHRAVGVGEVHSAVEAERPRDVRWERAQAARAQAEAAGASAEEVWEAARAAWEQAE